MVYLDKQKLSLGAKRYKKYARWTFKPLSLTITLTFRVDKSTFDKYSSFSADNFRFYRTTFSDFNLGS
jgi:hypothetical protein